MDCGNQHSFFTDFKLLSDPSTVLRLTTTVPAAAMLLSRTSNLLAGLHQPASHLLQKSSKNAIVYHLLDGSKTFSTASVLGINKHPDVIRGKVADHLTQLSLLLSRILLNDFVRLAARVPSGRTNLKNR